MKNLVIVILLIIIAVLSYQLYTQKTPQPAQYPPIHQSTQQYLQSQGVKTPQIPQPPAPKPVNGSTVQGQTIRPGASVAGGVQTFTVFISKGDAKDHFTPSGWMGDYGDLRMNDHLVGNCHSKDSCVQFAYSAQKVQGAGWTGVYWQNPADNWGNIKGGYNLAGMKKLTFWAKGDHGGETIQKFVVGGIGGTYPDSTKVAIGPIKLAQTWRQYTIDLSGHDLSYINGGFGFTVTAGLNPNGCTFYLDTIQYEGTLLLAQDKTAG